MSVGSQFRTSSNYLEPYFIENDTPFKLRYTQDEIVENITTKVREYISGDELVPFGSPEQTRFMRRVYEIQRKHAATKRKFIDNLPPTMLQEIKPKQGITMRKDAALACRLLLRKAEDDLLAQNKNNVGISKITKKFGIVSGYRSATKQFSNWRSFFENKYYPETRKLRAQKVGGEHSDSAANFLAAYIGNRLGSPGYSYHNDGLAVDFFAEENGIKLGANTDPKNISRWRKTWFFDWLSKHAEKYGFFQNTRINEPWHWEYKRASPVNNSALPLLSTQMILGETHYANIDLKINDTDPKTGIYIPPTFIRGSKANLIIYLHGFKYGFPEASAAIDKYWDSKKFPFFAFREGLRKSKKNAILVAPTLGPKSQSGTLLSKGLDWYLEQILGFLKRKGIAKKIEEVILACHSGAGSLMLRLAGSNYKNKIIECWGFDCLYSGKDKFGKKLFTQPDKWLEWAKKNPDKRLYIYFYDSTALESQRLLRNKINQNVNNVFVKKSDAKPLLVKMPGKEKKVLVGPHFWVPIMDWQNRLLQLRWS